MFTYDPIAENIWSHKIFGSSFLWKQS